MVDRVSTERGSGEELRVAKRDREEPIWRRGSCMDPDAIRITRSQSLSNDVWSMRRSSWIFRRSCSEASA